MARAAAAARGREIAIAIEYLTAVRSFNRDTRLYPAAAGLHALAVMGIFGVLLNLYLLRFGHGPEFIGLINAAGLIEFAVFSVPAGMLAQIWGMKRTMLASLGVGVLAMGLFPLADLLPSSVQGPWMAGANLAGAFSTAAFHVSIMPYLMASTSAAERRQAFSMRWALFYLGGFAGSIMGGLLPGMFVWVTSDTLASVAPYRFSLLVTSILLLGVLWAIAHSTEIRLRSDSTTGSRSDRFPLAMFATFAAIVVLLAAAEGTAQVFFNVYLDVALELATVQIGILIGMGRVVGIGGAILAPAVASRLGNGQTVALTSLAAAMALVPLALISHWAAAGVAFVVLNISMATLAPAQYLFMFSLVGERWRLAIASTSIAAGVAGFSLMALGGGYVIARFGYPSIFLLAAAGRGRDRAGCGAFLGIPGSRENRV